MQMADLERVLPSLVSLPYCRSAGTWQDSAGMQRTSLAAAQLRLKDNAIGVTPASY